LIGITDDAGIAIQVSYARTVEEVYSEATAYLINAEGNVDMLLDARASRQNGPLPSWVQLSQAESD
jgi:SHS2 domain-containing protein